MSLDFASDGKPEIGAVFANSGKVIIPLTVLEIFDEETAMKFTDPVPAISGHYRTSQLTDKPGAGRDHYANEAYSEFRRKFQADPAVDFLVCGDFNTEPDNESVVKHLHAGSDPQAVRNAREEPLLLDMFAGKDPAKFGTHYYHKPLIYDHVCISAGLLDDKGWTCLTDTAQTWTQGMIRGGAPHREPWRFGNEKASGGRGYSDHFPVTVKLKVN